MACVATWAFGLVAVERAARELEEGVECVEAVEAAVNVVEDDPAMGRYLVGRGCYPNSQGVVELDAAIMRGQDCALGAVCALEGCAKPISVARHIMEHCDHSVLVGAGAKEYAKQNNFVIEKNDSLLVPETKKAYKEFKSEHRRGDQARRISDTLSVLCLDKFGNIAAGVSTSGRPFKSPGRVGDSPLPGCGYYADSQVGAAAATGDGEKIMKFCPSHHVVEQIRMGRGPQEACEIVLKSMIDRNGSWFEVALIALDMQGNVGACGTVNQWTDFRSGECYDGFPYAVWVKGKTPVIKTKTTVDYYSPSFPLYK